MQAQKKNRREWMASVAMAVGLVVSYGVLAFQGFLFLLPRRTAPRTRNLFAGRINQFEIGGVDKFLDLEGNEILIRRKSDAEFQAFSSTCPHLGCKVRWEEGEEYYLCPCHMGIFDADGTAISGPPADGGQRLAPVPLVVDADAGVVYVQVRDSERGMS
jgi:Rieske Fe-S protein